MTKERIYDFSPKAEGSGYQVNDRIGALECITRTSVLDIMSEEVRACNIEKGWYDEDRTFGDDIALLHSEVSEMLEAFRITGNALDQTKDGTSKPEGVGAEAADVLVRLLDTCSRYGVDLFAEWRRKVDYNWTRPQRHGNKAL